MARADGMHYWDVHVGSILLLARKGWALWSFAVSLAGLFGGTVYSYFLSDGSELMGTTGMIFNFVIWIIALFLIWYSWSMKQRGVLS